MNIKAKRKNYLTDAQLELIFNQKIRLVLEGGGYGLNTIHRTPEAGIYYSPVSQTTISVLGESVTVRNLICLMDNSFFDHICRAYCIEEANTNVTREEFKRDFKQGVRKELSKRIEALNSRNM